MRNENKITRADLMSDEKLKQAEIILWFFYVLFSIANRVTFQIFNEKLGNAFTKIAVWAFDRAIKI